jgi:drug/metabolite transporter (DMT)-like permease
MNRSTLLLILCSVCLSAVAQVVLKGGVTGRLGANENFPGGLLQVLLSPAVIGGMALYALGAIVWLYVLARVDVSYAYPFVGLGFILTMVFGWALYAEVISGARIVGTCLVAIGIFLIARS